MDLAAFRKELRVEQKGYAAIKVDWAVEEALAPARRAFDDAAARAAARRLIHFDVGVADELKPLLTRYAHGKGFRAVGETCYVRQGASEEELLASRVRESVEKVFSP